MQNMATVAVQALGSDGGLAQRWDDYVTNHANGTFFHLSGWRQPICAVLGHSDCYLLATMGGPSGAIVGVLPLVEVRGPFGHYLSSSPFLVYGGPLSDDAIVQTALLGRAQELARERGASYLELRSEQDVAPDWPAKDMYVTFKRELDTDHDDNLKAIPRKQRAVVRKGIKLGLTSRVESDVDEFYRVFSESYRNLGTPILSKRFYASILATFPEQTEVLSILDGDTVVSSVVSFKFRDQILPYYGGGGSSARRGANDFMYWEVMRRAVEDGIKVFDYGRSKKDSGSYSFKKHWGFEPTPLHYQYHLAKGDALPDVNPNNPKFKAMIAVWTRLPVGLTRVIGPPVARYLG